MKFCLVLLQNALYLLQQNSSRYVWKESVDEDVHKESAIHYPISKGMDQTNVKLIHDKKWFDDKAQAGCCPYAVTLYAQRYNKVNHRCCTDRLGEIEPWRPIGGPEGWEEISPSLYNSSVFMQGDSLAEQHFLALLCYAWSSNHTNVTSLVNTNNVDGKWLLKDGTCWEATIEPVGVTLKFCRWSKPTVIPDFDYSTVDHLIIGGWHHGGVGSSEMNSFLDQIASAPSTLVVQALPAHFPGNGGSFSGYNRSMNAESWTKATANHTNLLCNVYSNYVDPPINKLMTGWVEGRQSMKILRVQHLYEYRGDAHIGFIPKNVVGPKERDCLHWCIAPGVLDPLAMETLDSLNTQ